MRLRFPVLWITVLAFACVAVISKNLSIGGFVLLVVLPVVLGCQWVVRRVMVSLRYSVEFRRSVMLIPAMVVALVLGVLADFMRFTKKASLYSTHPLVAVSHSLAGHVPEGLSELRVSDAEGSDGVVRVYFECDPASLRDVLEKPPFEWREHGAGTFSFRLTPFKELYDWADLKGIVKYRRNDLEEAKRSCVVYTDKAFSFAYVEYGGSEE